MKEQEIDHQDKMVRHSGYPLYNIITFNFGNSGHWYYNVSQMGPQGSIAHIKVKKKKLVGVLRAVNR